MAQISGLGQIPAFDIVNEQTNPVGRGAIILKTNLLQGR